jgi:hypothetical protein
MTASFANAEAIFHCQHVLIITAKMPAAATEERILPIILSLGMEKGNRNECELEANCIAILPSPVPCFPPNCHAVL